jgi:hypothetical protein
MRAHIRVASVRCKPEDSDRGRFLLSPHTPSVVFCPSLVRCTHSLCLAYSVSVLATINVSGCHASVFPQQLTLPPISPSLNSRHAVRRELFQTRDGDIQRSCPACPYGCDHNTGRASRTGLCASHERVYNNGRRRGGKESSCLGLTGHQCINGHAAFLTVDVESTVNRAVSLRERSLVGA